MKVVRLHRRLFSAPRWSFPMPVSVREKRLRFVGVNPVRRWWMGKAVPSIEAWKRWKPPRGGWMPFEPPWKASLTRTPNRVKFGQSRHCPV